MPERAQVFEATQLGFEATPGTAVPATKRLIGTTIAPKLMTSHKTYRPKGSRMTTGGVQNKEWTEASIDGDPALYTDISYVRAMAFGAPSISVIGGGCFGHTWTPLNFTGITPKPATVESGGFVRARKFPYGVVKSLGMEGSRDGVKLTGAMIGQLSTLGVTLTAGTNEVQTLHKTGTVSGGTYTITFMGETTSALAFGANNAAVLAALEALPNIAPGDVVLTGGPAGTTDLVITFGGQYASGDVPLMVVSSALLTGGGTYDIAQTTAGAPMSSTSFIPVSGSQWDFYLDTTGAGVGGTKLTRCFKWSWGINDLFGPVWPGNTANTSYAAIVDLPPSTTFSFTVEGDATGEGFVTQLRSGDLVFIRIKMTGPTLGSGTYLIQDDFAVEISAISDNEDQDGVFAQTYTGEIAFDSTWGKYVNWLVQNNISAIS